VFEHRRTAQEVERRCRDQSDARCVARQRRMSSDASVLRMILIMIFVERWPSLRKKPAREVVRDGFQNSRAR
jgi:hypothetical protein